MKLSLLLAAAISLASISFIPSQTVRASSFEEQELNQHQFAVIAAPYRHGYNLVVLEQIPGQQKCWAETGNSPTVIEPLFLNFDFTNACKRNSDSNNYSIRLNGRDHGLDYLTDIVEQAGELHLIGVPRDRSLPQLHIGRTHGLSSGSLKIILNPEWRLTKRIYGDRATDHVYLSKGSDSSDKLVSHAVESVTPTSQQPYYPQVAPTTPVAQPVPTYQQPIYQQPVYQQPVYQQPVYQQPLPQQQPLYPVQLPQQPVGNYQQPVYPTQPVNNGYRQY